MRILDLLRRRTKDALRSAAPPEGQAQRDSEQPLQARNSLDTASIRSAIETEPSVHEEVRPPLSDRALLLEIGRQAGLREQKLEEMHQDIRFIRDKMALETELDEMRTEMKENASRLVDVIGAAKEMILARLESIQPIQPGPESIRRETASRQPCREAALSSMEARVLEVLVQSGALTYAEIAERVGITPLYAKALVNRVCRKTDDLRKRRVEGRNVVDAGSASHNEGSPRT